MAYLKVTKIIQNWLYLEKKTNLHYLGLQNNLKKLAQKTA